MRSKDEKWGVGLGKSKWDCRNWCDDGDDEQNKIIFFKTKELPL